MMSMGLAVPILLCASAALAQNVTDIETRGAEPTHSDYHVLRGGGGGRGGDTDSLLVTFELPNGYSLPIGQKYDYEVTVINKSTEEILLPRCIEWSDIADGHPKEIKYQTLEVDLIFGTPKTGNTYLGGNLILYGETSKPSTMIALRPGDSLRLHGRVKLTAPWLPLPANTSLKVHLRAAVSLSSVWLHPTPTPNDPNGYSQDPKEIYFIRSDNDLPVELTTKEALVFPPKPETPLPDE